MILRYLRHMVRDLREDLRYSLKWLAASLLIGLLSGVIGSAFHHGVHLVTDLRALHPWLLWCLPLAGLAIVGFYALTKTDGVGTNDILEEIQSGKGLPLLLLPAIFLGTVLTHLCGGSAGREGAALQMGGTIGYHAGRLLRLGDKDLRIATTAGMAAFFTALFGTPLAATVFALVVVNVGRLYLVSLVPSLMGSLTAFGVSRLLQVEPTRFTVAAPELEVWMLARVALLGVLCAAVSVLFCEGIHIMEHWMKHRLPNPWIRAAAGGGAVIALTYLCGTTDYNGAGMDVIVSAVEQGTARPEAFLLKLLFTAVTLAAGFKGGEVVPSFFVGAAFGCVAGPLLGIPAGFAAGVGLIAVFCGATNCPLASIFLAIELMGDGGLLYFALACGISFMLSGYSGLYSSQRIVYAKLEATYINLRANPSPEEEP